MIIFEKDWLRYRRAIADTKTQNKYFLKFCKMLKDMGVRHWYFPLALHNPELAGLSPYDPHLTKEQKSAMLYECDQNPWWYLRELVLDEKGGDTLDDKRFRAHRGNIAAMWLILACIDYIWVAPRQTGKSYGADSNTNWLQYFKYRDTDMNLITKDNKTRISNVNRIKSIRDAWPAFMCRNTKDDAANQTSTSCIELGNNLFTHVAQSSEKGANGLGRGLTSPYLQIDEAAFILWIRKVLQAASGGTNTAREIARRKKVPYCTVFTTTAGDVEDRDGSFVHQMWLEGAEFLELFYDCDDRDHLIDMILKNSASESTSPFVNLTLSHRQLGYTDAWLLDAIHRARGETADVDKDYFNRWGSSSDNSRIPKEIAKIIKEHEKEPTHTQVTTNNYLLKWYRPIREDTFYVWAIDTSNAVDRDGFAIVLLDARDGGVCAVANIKETNLISLYQWILDLLLMLPNSVCIIENMHGAQNLIDYLIFMLPQYDVDPFKKLFSKIVQDMSEHREAFREINSSGIHRPKMMSDRYKKYVGFKTNAESRQFLYGPVLSNAVKQNAKQISDRELSHQLLGLRTKNNRVDHANGGHDDLVIAYLVGQWFLEHGMNLSYYGLDPSIVFKDRLAVTEEENPVNVYMHVLQNMHRERLQRLEESRKRAKDEFVQRRLDAEIRRLKHEVEDDEVVSGNTMDQLVHNAKERGDPRITKDDGTRRRHTARQLLQLYGGG